jgi:hypothetical protein
MAPGLALYSALRWLLAACLFVALVRSRLPLETLMAVFLAGMGLQAIIGIAQFFKPGPLGLPGELALPTNLPEAPVITFLGAVRLRAYGLTFNPNVLGGFLGAGLVLGLPLIRRWPVRLAWWLCGVGLLLTFSRSAWLSTAITLPLATAWLAWKNPALRRSLAWTLGPPGLGLAAGSLFLAGDLFSRLNLIENFGEMILLSARGELIRIALEAIGAHPILGIGAGNFPLVQALYWTSDQPHFVHNVPLLLASEIGISGGLIWLWLWLAPGIALERVWKRASFWPGILVAAWFGWGTVGLWDSYPWSLEAGRLFSVFLLALIAREMAQTQ